MNHIKVIFLAFLGLLLAADYASPKDKSQPLRPSPELFFSPSHQSPVAGGPGDLLFIPGAGFESGAEVVYRETPARGLRLLAEPPYNQNARRNTADSGRLRVLDEATSEDGITVILAEEMRSDIAYTLWARNPGSEWSRPVVINDARPLWVTPARVYSSLPLVEGLARTLKVVGRNLHPAPRNRTLVRLLGPRRVTLAAHNDTDPQTYVENFVAKVDLPSLPVGEYRVQVSRDGDQWVDIDGQHLEVVADPEWPAEFPVTAHATDTEPCLADDDLDDTGCIVRAIEAAALSVPAVVTFGAGQWDIRFEDEMFDQWIWGRNGIPVPKGVSLQGEGPEATRIVKTLPDLPSSWDASFALFTLLGEQSVSGIHFHHATRDLNESTLRLGGIPHMIPADERHLADISISHCKFTEMLYAVSSNLAIDRLVLAKNLFNAFAADISISPVPIPEYQQLILKDAVIVDNVFHPGDYDDPQSQSGVLASAIGSSIRLDMSDNVVDGQVNGGWRAGFFWHEGFTHEMMLVSNNQFSCTGDKGGDGEAIAFDANYHDAAFYSLAPVTGATNDSLTIEATLKEDFDGYYNGHWAQVVRGKGIGQARRIVAYETTGDQVTLQVEPEWDVLPDPSSSEIMVSEVYWQINVVDNTADQNGCIHNNPNAEEPGIFGMVGNTYDSAMWGNQLLGTGSIITAYNAHLDGFSRGCSDFYPEGDGPIKLALFSHFTDFRYNLIDRTVPTDIKPRSIYGGFMIPYAGNFGTPTAVLSTGMTIAHNRITNSYMDQVFSGSCDGNHHRFGAIAADGWTDPSGPDLIRGLMLFDNTISDVPRGIHIGSNHVEGAALKGNLFNNVDEPIYDAGTDTVVLP